MTGCAEGGIDWAWLWRDNRADLGAIAFVAAFITAIVLCFDVTPFHYVDMLVMFLVATGPTLLVFAIFSGLGDRLASESKTFSQILCRSRRRLCAREGRR